MLNSFFKADDINKLHIHIRKNEREREGKNELNKQLLLLN